MKRQLIATLIVCVSGLPVVAQETHPATVRLEKHALSRKMQIAGSIGLVMGVAIVLPKGTTYNVTGTDVCVDKYSVEMGPCTGEPHIGMMVLLASGAMLAIGSIPVTKRVRVAPQVSPSSVGVVSTVRW